ncbi:MAG: hypothetical protein ACSLEZ_06505, partial [Thiobacillus sp.]
MTHALPTFPRQPVRLFAVSVLLAAMLAACNSDDAPAVIEATPASLTLQKIGDYSAGVFGASAAEIPA